MKRDGAERTALLRGLVTNVIERERVITTVPKAKAARPLVERMITLGKQDMLHARRAEQAMIELVGSELVKRAADRAKRREERERAAREGREPGEEE